ncbi:hypothetical protein BEWA_015720 [Theileria equi strain WA]|uniref:Uncharacterized protein n=1 Tax=Theileria equi strain WA TaxID=1537102 RepID=L1LCE0_THEEQ|nr:hypothetical protein BEWA_015720 [Theileria equi strain WA]EKX73011.1 hypothetical protein BEWA_015720 [Theileria equi strain WA]|eukprot:XP_004832463.1 hypothetical protein BEWA_015720 [Theileria equi strain WA]
MGTKYSVIDVAKDAENNTPTTYYGRNGYTITLSRKDEPEIDVQNEDKKEKLLNYKFYYHTIPDDWDGWSVYYQLKRVEYNGVAQSGLETRGNLSNYRRVCVIYWLNDQHNLLPLIIGLDSGSVTYFKRGEDVISNTWKWANNIVPPANLSDYQRVLSELNENFKNVVIVNLNAGNGQKYCGHPSKDEFKDPKDNPENCSQNGTSLVTVTVSEIGGGTVPKGFNCLKHSATDTAKIRILSTYHGNSMISFTESIVATEHKCLNAYYTSGSRSGKPLLLELSNGENQGTSTLYTLKNDKWVPPTHSQSDLTKALDQENCMRNNTVVVDLSKKRDKYCCGMNGHNKIQVLQHHTNVPDGYTSYMHLNNGYENNFSFNIHRFKDGEEHMWPGSINKIKSVYAYFCKGDGQIMPLLLYVNKGSGYGKWFKRTSGSNSWIDTDLSSLQSHTPNSPSITKPIEIILREICKELKIGCQHAPEGNTAGGEPPVSSQSTGSGSSTGSGGNSGGSGSPEAQPEEVIPKKPVEDVTTHSGGGGAKAGGPNGGTDEANRQDTAGDGQGPEGASATGSKNGSFIERATDFLKSQDGIITASVTSVITTGGIGGITYSCLKRRKL